MATQTDDIAITVAQKQYPHLWNGDYERALTGMSGKFQHNPEQAEKSAERRRKDRINAIVRVLDTLDDLGFQVTARD